MVLSINEGRLSEEEREKRKDKENGIIKEEEKETGFKRICGTRWHEEIELKRFEECPICHSTSNHVTIPIKIEVKGENNEI